MAMIHRQPRNSYHWRHWYETLLDADLETLDVSEVAKDYLVSAKAGEPANDLVCDPLPEDMCGFELRVPLPSRVSPLRALASAAESMATELARVRADQLSDNRDSLVQMDSPTVPGDQP